jgi:thiamine biosynthesis protein ThiS
MITLQVNGKEVELDAPIPLVLYIEKLGVNPRAVAVEHNGAIIEHAQFASVVLHEGDRVEIVRMVGGGRSAGRTAS